MKETLNDLPVDEVLDLLHRIEEKNIQLSFSSLKNFRKHPEAFIRYKLLKPPPTKDMAFSRFFHFLLLEGEEDLDKNFMVGGSMPSTEKQGLFCEEILIKVVNRLGKKNIKAMVEAGVKDSELLPTEDEIDKAFTKAYKSGSKSKTWESVAGYVLAVLKGLEVISEEDMDRAKYLKTRVMSNPSARALLDQVVETEQKIEWEAMGWPFIGYLDGRSELVKGRGKFILDLKLTDPDPEALRRQILKMKWYIQAAMYLDGEAQGGRIFESYWILAVDPKNGDCSVIKIDQDFLLYGLHEYKLMIQDLNKCVLMKKWKANFEFYGRKVDEIPGAYIATKPNWAPTLGPVYEEDLQP